MIVFKLTMPRQGSWDGKWSGENLLHVIVKSESSIPDMSIVGKQFSYNFGDGWVACISVEQVDSSVARRLEAQSEGFCGYDWMVDSILENGNIKC